MQIDETGITYDTKESIFAEIENDLKKYYGQNFEIKKDGAFATMVNLIVSNCLEIQDVIKFLSLQYNPETACGDWQDSLYERIGIYRLAPQETVITVNVSGTKNFDFEAESIIIRAKSDETEFINTDTFTTDGNGSATINFQCTKCGNITVSQTEEFNIVSAPIGIESVELGENFQISVGRERESDEDYRKRFRISKALNSCASKLSTFSGLYQYVDSPEFLNIIDKKDDNTMPDGTFEIIACHNTTDEIFAQAIYDRMAIGTKPTGDTTVIIKDVRGENIPISFSKAQAINIVLVAKVKIQSGYNTEKVIAEAKSKVLEYIDTRIFGLGATVYATEFIIPLLNTEGIEAVLDINIKHNNETADKLELNKKQIPAISDINITLT